MNIEREARENIRREVTSHGGEVDFFRHNGEITRAVIRWCGRSREVRFKRVSSQPQVMRSIMADTRREMRNLGIIDRDKGREPIRSNQVGAIGAKLLEAVKKAVPEEFAPPPAPVRVPESEVEIDVGSDEDEIDEVDDDWRLPEANFLCPDEIASLRAAGNRVKSQIAPPSKETKPMTEFVAATSGANPPMANGKAEAPEVKTAGTAGTAGTGIKLSHAQVFAATKLMIEHGRSGTDGIFVWDQGWNDERVHREIGAKSSVLAVTMLRKKGGLKLASEVHTPAKSDSARIEALEKMVGELKARLDAVGA